MGHRVRQTDLKQDPPALGCKMETLAWPEVVANLAKQSVTIILRKSVMCRFFCKLHTAEA